MQEENQKNSEPDGSILPIDQKKADHAIDEMTNALPEVNQDAVDNAQNETHQQATDKFSGLFDRNGNPFDPDLHSVDENGHPALTKAGKLKIKSRGAGARRSKLNIPQQESAELQKEAASRRYTAEFLASTFIQITSGLMGEEWLPEKEPVDEKKHLVDSTDEYFKHVGFVEPPPFAVFLIAYGLYSSKRLAKPKTKTILGHVKGKIAGWWKKITKKGRKKNGSFLNSGDNGKREDDASVHNGEEVQR